MSDLKPGTRVRVEPKPYEATVERLPPMGGHVVQVRLDSNESWCTYGNRDGKVWHGPCIAYEQWRRAAEEHLTVIALMAEVWDISKRDVETVASLREEDWTGPGRYQDLVWRTFYALEKRPKAVSR